MSDTNATIDPSEIGPTKPLPEHEWLQNLVGEWTVESEMYMDPAGEPMRASGRESVTLLGGLWAVGEGVSSMPDGSEMVSRNGLGYDVSFKEYRGFWLASMSSHLWKYVGTLSADGKTMTLECEGPDMVNDGQTAMYRDVIAIVDSNHRTLTSYGQDDKGEWQRFMVAKYTRV